MRQLLTENRQVQAWLSTTCWKALGFTIGFGLLAQNWELSLVFGIAVVAYGLIIENSTINDLIQPKQGLLVPDAILTMSIVEWMSWISWLIFYQRVLLGSELPALTLNWISFAVLALLSHAHHIVQAVFLVKDFGVRRMVTSGWLISASLVEALIGVVVLAPMLTGQYNLLQYLQVFVVLFILFGTEHFFGGMTK